MDHFFECLFDFISILLKGVGIGALIWFCIMRPIANMPYERWNNPPPPPSRKSINYGYQPTNKVDTSNPPKETGT